VFDLFVQSRRTLDRAEGGLGLGLTIVRMLAALHGGEVEAFSEGEGKGTELVVRLPLTLEAPKARDSEPKPIRNVPPGARIAVIEDNTDSRELLCELLSGAGFECAPAEDGLSGIALIETFNPHVAFIDVGLPKLDGFEVARRARATRPNTILIALTGYGQVTDQQRALAAGFDEHLVKPMREKDLARILGQPSDFTPSVS
jgi:CheY-like chemotaxis protein